MSSTWDAPVECSVREERLLKLCKKRKLWVFLRRHRHELLDDDIRSSLHAMYASGSRRAGTPVAPERMLLAMLLQVAFGIPDHDVPTLTVVDQRWQMVLDCFDVERPALSQGALFNFRERARANGLMEVFLEKTVALARQTKGFGHTRLRAMIDSSPLTGAGRVEDTFNLIGRALQRLVLVAAEESGTDAAELASELKVSVFQASSVKAVLDVDWRKPMARTAALQVLLRQFAGITAWLEAQFTSEQLAKAPLSDAVDLVQAFIDQDTEPDPDGTDPDARRLTQGTTKNRRISVSDADMRHGVKSKAKTINGYKDHYTVDADVPGLIVDAEVVPANRPENEGAAPMLERIAARGFEVVELHADRGYLQTALRLHGQGVVTVTKPPTPSRRDGFGKQDFTINAEAGTVTCPQGETTTYKGDGLEHRFRSKICRECPVYRPCVAPKNIYGKRIKLHASESFLREMATDLATASGRAKRRERIGVEHVMARVAAVRGRRARFRGLEKVQFDSKRTAVIVNLYVLAALKNAA